MSPQVPAEDVTSHDQKRQPDPHLSWVRLSPSACATSRVRQKLPEVPDNEFVGTDTFDVTVDDGNGGTATASVTVTVSEVPDPSPTRPVTTDDCGDGGWRAFTDPSFRSQGECIAWVSTGGRGGLTPR